MNKTIMKACDLYVGLRGMGLSTDDLKDLVDYAMKHKDEPTVEDYIVPADENS